MARRYGGMIWERLEKYPPVLCRLLARLPKGRPLSNHEIATRSGLSHYQVEAISRQTDWRGVDLPTARAFMVACNTDLSNREHCRRIWMYLKTQPRNPSKRFGYLRRSPDWGGYYLPLIEVFAKHLIHARSKIRAPDMEIHVRPEQANRTAEQGSSEAKAEDGPKDPVS